MRLNEYASTRRTRGSYKIPTSVQKSIPIDEIYADGTWRSGEVYSQMWSVSDINYRPRRPADPSSYLPCPDLPPSLGLQYPQSRLHCSR